MKRLAFFALAASVLSVGVIGCAEPTPQAGDAPSAANVDNSVKPPASAARREKGVEGGMKVGGG